MTGDEGAVPDFHVVIGSASFQKGMQVAGRDQGPSPKDGVPIGGFLDPYHAE